MTSQSFPRRFLPLATAGLACLLGVGATDAQQVSADLCGSLSNAIGPWDYRNQRENLRIVEIAHFTPKVETLIGGQGSQGPAGDLDYTLRAFPNHHRALVSIMRLTERTKSLHPPGLARPGECYFERAVRWRPDDTVARMLYAQFLYLWKRSAEAEAQLKQAAHVAGDNPMTQYNIGLVYLEGGNRASALVQAHKAYALGFTRPELRERLQQSGHWREPETTPGIEQGPAEAPASAASAAQPSASAADR